MERGCRLARYLHPSERVYWAMNTSDPGSKRDPFTVKSISLARTPDQVTLATCGPPVSRAAAMLNWRETRGWPFAVTRAVQTPGCDAGANPAMGSWLVKHSSAAAGRSP